MVKPFELLPMKPSQKKQTVEMLTETFQDDPLYRLIMPEENRRRRMLLCLHDKVIKYSMLFGTIYVLPSLKGTACWLHPGRTDITIGKILRSGLYMLPLVMGPAAYLRFNSYLKLSEHLRKENTPEPFWYLWVIGVDKRHQGKGIGGKLMRPVMERADSERTVCFLETENEKNLGFYEKHNFHITATGTIPGSSQPMWSMIRNPTGSASTDQ